MRLRGRQPTGMGSTRECTCRGARREESRGADMGTEGNMEVWRVAWRNKDTDGSRRLERAGGTRDK